jgi:trimeric autotransporter adhesin
MNTLIKSVRRIGVATIVVAVLTLAPTQAQTAATKLADTSFRNGSEFRLDLFRSTAGRQRVAARPAGFALMPESRTAVTMMPTAAGANLQVLGSGTLGRLTKWTGFTTGNSFVGDSNIFEDKFGKVGIGTATPTSPLTVAGTIEITLGGLKFADATVQTTAGLAAVFHDGTLRGDGTQGSRLGVAVPLELVEAVVGDAIFTAINTAERGNAIVAIGGEVTSLESGPGRGGIGVSIVGGFSELTGATGGAGIFSVGGTAINLDGSGNDGGEGVFARGGGSIIGIAGPGVRATGGATTSGRPGDGLEAIGGAAGGAGSGGAGVRTTGGGSLNDTFGGPGVEATGGTSINGFGGPGVLATGGASNTSQGGGGLAGVGGRSDNGRGGVGVVGFGGLGSGVGNSGGAGIEAFAGSATNGANIGLAGRFNGGVEVLGDFNVTGTKNFKIDHPLDPANKYLVHAAIESSEVLNVYSGNVKTNEKGEATVFLPDWFEALNRDFRYQLTVVGTFAQAIVQDEIRNNRFKIRTSAPDVKVSWQVSGLRSDAALRRRPFQVEEDKPERERGTYVNPEAYNQPEERGAEWARNPEQTQQIKEAREKALKSKQD